MVCGFTLAPEVDQSVRRLGAHGDVGSADERQAHAFLRTESYHSGVCSLAVIADSGVVQVRQRRAGPYGDVGERRGVRAAPNSHARDAPSFIRRQRVVDDEEVIVLTDNVDGS